MKKILQSGQFKKDFKRYRHKPQMIQALNVVIEYLRNGDKIPANYYPHKLCGAYEGYMECHIMSDYLLVWIDETQNIVRLMRLGTHSEIFRN